MTCERTVWTDYAINATFDELSKPLRNAIRNVAEASYREGLRAQDENNRELEAACAAMRRWNDMYNSSSRGSWQCNQAEKKAFASDAGRALLAELDAWRMYGCYAASCARSGEHNVMSFDEFQKDREARKACDENG